MSVIGGGQSALESAALLNEMGASVEVLVRAPFVRWLWRQKWFHTFRPVARLLYAPPDVGQAGLSHLVARPNLFRRLPRSTQNRLGKRAIRPAGAAWLHPRCESVRITTGLTVTSASSAGGRATLRIERRYPSASRSRYFLATGCTEWISLATRFSQRNSCKQSTESLAIRNLMPDFNHQFPGCTSSALLRLGVLGHSCDLWQAQSSPPERWRVESWEGCPRIGVHKDLGGHSYNPESDRTFDRNLAERLRHSWSRGDGRGLSCPRSGTKFGASGDSGLGCQTGRPSGRSHLPVCLTQSAVWL